MEVADLRSAIVNALEEGAPRLGDGLPLRRFEDLFAAGESGPLLGLCFDERSLAIVALPLADAFAKPFFVPFDFDASRPEEPGRCAQGCARRMMATMAAMLRENRLPTLDDALDKAGLDIG